MKRLLAVLFSLAVMIAAVLGPKSHNHSYRRRNHAKRNSQFLPQIGAAIGEM
jgi:hypothetical protein